MKAPSKFAPLLALILLLAPAAHAQTAEQALSQFLDGTRTVQAAFTQTQTDDRGRASPTTVGEMTLSRPGGFRWDVQQPNAQLIVTNGKTLWLYDQDLRQVTVRPAAEALQGTPAALLMQGKALRDTFKIEVISNSKGIAKLRLLPKAASNDFTQVDLWLKGGAPVRMIFRDQFGGATDISFSGVRTNQAVAEAKFAFSPPKGTEVVDETQAKTP